MYIDVHACYTHVPPCTVEGMRRANSAPGSTVRPKLTAEANAALEEIQAKLSGYVPASPIDKPTALIILVEIARRHERELRALARQWADTQ